MCLGVRSRCFGAEPLLSSWDGRERHGTGLWTGTHTSDEEKNKTKKPQNTQIYKGGNGCKNN